MKTLRHIITMLLIPMFFLNSLVAQESMLQQRCPNSTDATTMASDKAMWDILNYFETTSSSQGGVATDGNFIYTSSFSTELFRKFEMDGTFVEEFTIPGIDKIACLTFDGTYFCGAMGLIENGINILDLENHSVVNTISVNAPSIIGIGHISWDPDLDGGNGGFWIGYWHELCAVDKQGNEIIPNVVTGLTGLGGTALDKITDPANPGLFCFQQTGSSNLEITKFDINTQTFSDVLHVATDIPGPSGGSNSSVASGMNSYINNDGKLVLLGLIDCFPGNEMVFQYEISNAFNYTHDMSVQSIITPVTGDNLGDQENIVVKLLNNGTETESNFDIQYTINNGTGTIGPFTQNVTSSIDAGDFLSVTFDQTADLSMAGVSYTIEITAFLSSDENEANDVFVKVITNTSGNYCDATGGSSSSQEYISNVNLSGISNSSGADHYADYTSDTDLYMYLDPNSGSQITITLANPYNADICAIWIDWNDNGDFYDAGDNIYVSPMGQGPYSTMITPPASALQNTLLRMRIRVDYNNPSPDPCGSSSFGEVEDYTVIVSAIQLNPPLNLQYELIDENIELSWDSPSTKDLTAYNIYYSKNMGNFELLGNVAVGTNHFTTENPGEGIHRYFITAVYGDDGESVPSNIVEVLITGLSEKELSHINIYPNPVSSILHINAASMIENIKIFDYSGKLVLDKTLKSDQIQIDTQELESGFYIIEIKTQSTTSYHNLIIL